MYYTSVLLKPTFEVDDGGQKFSADGNPMIKTSPRYSFIMKRVRYTHA